MIARNKLSTLTFLGLVASLALTGCSSDGGGGSPSGGGKDKDSVYEFQTNGITPSKEVTIRLPDDLRKAMGPKADSLIADKVVAKGHKLEGVDNCAVDLAITYAKGEPEALLKAHSKENLRAQREADLLGRMGVSSIDEAASELDKGIAAGTQKGVPPALLGQRLNKQSHSEVGSDYQPGDTGQALIERYLDKTTEKPDAEVVAGSFVLDGSVRSKAELDEASPKSGAYLSDDFKTITLVDDCAASATDPDNTLEFSLTHLNEEGKTKGLADVDLSVMTDGTIGVSGEVDDYMRDANDNWIAS